MKQHSISFMALYPPIVHSAHHPRLLKKYLYNLQGETKLRKNFSITPSEQRNQITFFANLNFSLNSVPFHAAVAFPVVLDSHQRLSKTIIKLNSVTRKECEMLLRGS